MSTTASGALPERVTIVYQTTNGDGSLTTKELPLRLLLLGDYSGRADPTPFDERHAVAISNDTFDEVLAKQRVTLDLLVPNQLVEQGVEGPALAVTLHISSLSDFAPEAIVGQIPALRQLADLRTSLAALKEPLPDLAEFHRKLQGLLNDAVARGRLLAALELGALIPVKKSSVDLLLADLDRRLARQLDAVLHHPQFQAIESAWRGLKLVVGRAEVSDNIRIHLLQVSKDELRADFEDAPEIMQSGFYKQVYTAEYGQFGGEPYAALIANYEFDARAQDVTLLHKVAAVAAMAHAPFIAAAGPRLFGLDSFSGLPNLSALGTVMDGPQYATWRAFRASDDARSVGLTVPRFLLRLPYGADTVPVTSFAYEENVASHGDYLWGNAAFAFATRLTDSFARYRWCPNVIGPQGGGTVSGLPLHRFAALGSLETRIPTEVLISERREFELAEAGFIPLAVRNGSENACFFSANSCQSPKSFAPSPEGRAAALNQRLGGQLPYLFIINRLAHYLKVLQREQLGSWKQKADLQRELNAWIGQFVVDMDDPEPQVRNTHPLRSAQIAVEDATGSSSGSGSGSAGWYTVTLAVRPHVKYLGASFTLSLVGKLEKSA